MVWHRRLILAAAAALLLGGCVHPNPNDPEVWRPKNPVYPMPK